MENYKKVWYVSLHRITKENDYIKFVNDAIYVQYFKTKKQAEEIEKQVNKNIFMAFCDCHADIDVKRLGIPAMFSLNPEKLPVYEVEDILAVV